MWLSGSLQGCVVSYQLQVLFLPWGMLCDLFGSFFRGVHSLLYEHPFIFPSLQPSFHVGFGLETPSPGLSDSPDISDINGLDL